MSPLGARKKLNYPVDYQVIKKNSPLCEGRSYFSEWVKSHLEENPNSLIMNDLDSFKAAFDESASNSKLDTEHSFSKSLANALYHAAKKALEEDLSQPATQLFYALSHLLPDSYDIFLGLGLAFQQQSNFDDSISAFNHAIKIHPQAFPAYVYIAESYLKLGLLDKFDEAISEANRLIPKGDTPFLRHIQFLKQQAKNKRG